MMAKCVGTATKSSNLSALIALLLANIESAHDESLQLFSLLCVGELGLEVYVFLTFLLNLCNTD